MFSWLSAEKWEVRSFKMYQEWDSNVYTEMQESWEGNFFFWPPKTFPSAPRRSKSWTQPRSSAYHAEVCSPCFLTGKGIGASTPASKEGQVTILSEVTIAYYLSLCIGVKHCFASLKMQAFQNRHVRLMFKSSSASFQRSSFQSYLTCLTRIDSETLSLKWLFSYSIDIKVMAKSHMLHIFSLHLTHI